MVAFALVVAAAGALLHYALPIAAGIDLDPVGLVLLGFGAAVFLAGAVPETVALVRRVVR